MAEDERSWPAEWPGEQQESSRRAGEAGLTAWLRRVITPRPRQIWVMEPDGRMRRVCEDAP